MNNGYPIPVIFQPQTPAVASAVVMYVPVTPEKECQ